MTYLPFTRADAAQLDLGNLKPEDALDKLLAYWQETHDLVVEVQAWEAQTGGDALMVLTSLEDAITKAEDAINALKDLF